MNQVSIGSLWKDKKSGMVWEIIKLGYQQDVQLKNGSLNVWLTKRHFLDNFEPYVEPTLEEMIKELCKETNTSMTMNGSDEYWFYNWEIPLDEVDDDIIFSITKDRFRYKDWEENFNPNIKQMKLITQIMEKLSNGTN